MDHDFLITSRDWGASLTLRPLDDDRFIAELRHSGLTATAGVWSYMSGGLGNFFADLAEHWRGWTGEKSWGSLEVELELVATSDRAGHVALLVRLQHGSPPLWRVEAQLALEAGQLDHLASEARAFETTAILSNRDDG